MTNNYVGREVVRARCTFHCVALKIAATVSYCNPYGNLVPNLLNIHFVTNGAHLIVWLYQYCISY